MENKPSKIFFSGIAGSGMSGIACFASDKGNFVWGSDRAFDSNPWHPVMKALEARGIRIVPQDGRGIDESFDLAVFSTAVEPDSPEAARAKELGVPVRTRPQYLAEIVAGYETVAVSGTSGKSTAAGMTAFLMQRLGMKPNFMGGGRVRQFKTDSNPGNSLTGSSGYLVIEACESDGSIVDYSPRHSVILNLALDHHPVGRTREMFEALVRNTSGSAVLNADDANLRAISAKAAATFSINRPSDYKAEGVSLLPLGSEFSIRGVSARLNIPGGYNIYNALSSLAVLSEMGVPLKDAAPALEEFRGIERRFDIHLDDGRMLVIDDYAHNPHKISSLMSAVNALRESICYIFQPHGFGPTRLMKDEYIEAFSSHLRQGDRLMLLPIFYAGGTASRDISSADLAEGIRARGKSAETAGREDVLMRLKEWDSYVVLGARDDTLSDFAEDIAMRLSRGATPSAGGATP
ncbi:MAG: Mur ligase domain-containing protein [Thermodesulfovibrionales bacterium]|nr:Mur ligase domain-containing protein [Thermodesulfovibrionales bacterium]